MSEENKTKRTFREEVEVAGNQLVDRVKELAKESSTRRVIIKNTEGEELISLPLTFGVIGGGILTLYAPLLAALGAVAALVTRVKLEVIREEEVTSETTALTDTSPPSQTTQE